MKSKWFRRCAHKAHKAVVLAQILTLVAAPITARANPLDPTVVGGSAAFDTSGATLTITTSDRAIIDWQSFGINPGEVTHFVQPGAGSAVLNRVIGHDPSALLGTLQANGQVFLINPHGIVVGAGAQINAGSFMATTLDVDNALFMRGGELNFQGDSKAPVINYGTIRALEGNVYLVANRVENHGVITATGNVGLAAANDVRLVDGAHPQLVVRPTSSSVGNASGGVQNTGMIEATKAELLAAHGNVYALAINNSGTIRSNGVEINDDGIFLTSNGGRVVNTGNLIAKQTDGSGGRVAIDATGQTINGGSAAASAQASAESTAIISGNINVAAEEAGKTGGQVDVTAGEVELASATINADGPGGGGVVRVGGDYQGGGSLPTATNTKVDATTTISANATSSGDAGRVILWADGRMQFGGTIRARGAGDGRGGFAEVSGKQILEYLGSADLGGGLLFLDPTDFTIDAAVASSIVTSINAGTHVTVSTNPSGGGNGDVSINSAIAANGTGALSIFAHRHVLANSSVTNDGTGNLTIVAGWDGLAQVPNAAGQVSFQTDGGAFITRADTYGNNGGNFVIDRTGSTLGVSVGSKGRTVVAARDILLTGSNTLFSGYAQIGYRPTVAGLSADLFVRATNDIVLNAVASKAHIGVGVNSSNLNNTDQRGSSIDVLAGRDIRILGGPGSFGSFAMIGNGGYNANSAYVGDIYVRAGRTIDVLAGTDASFAQLGNGGATSEGSHRGDIFVTAQELNIIGGSTSIYAQVGHGGNFSGQGTDAISGYIRIDVDELTVLGGGATSAVAQLGHGGTNFSSSVKPSGRMDVTVKGEMSFQNGTANARFGHWTSNFNAAGPANSPLYITVGTLDGSTSNATPATSANLGFINGEIARAWWGGSDIWFKATGLNGDDGDLQGLGLGIPNLTHTLTLQSTDRIRFDSSVSISGSGGLRLIADGDVIVSRGIGLTAGTGSMLLRADADGDGVGNVSFIEFGKVDLTGSSGTVRIQYTPTNYASPTDFIAAGKVVLGSSGATLNAQMLVNDVIQLQAISTNLSGNYVLGRDIDASATAAWNGGLGFAPLTSFGGRFDGDGHVIANLTINRPTTTNVGLFGVNTGTIANLGLINADIRGFDGVGTIAAGLSISGRITNVYASGTVQGRNNIAGIAASNYGLIEKAYSDVVVTSTGNVAGGIVAWNNSNGAVQNSYATGSVTATQMAGGIAGINTGVLSNVYASNLVSGTTAVGSLVGFNDDPGTMTNAYFESRGLPGVGTGNAGGTALGGAGPSSFAQASYTGFDFTNVWYISAGNTRPILRSEFSYTIQTAHQLQLMALDLRGSYTLARDINLAETRAATGVWNTTTGFVTIGDSSPTGSFNGKFDGDGHTLSNLFINRTATNYTGMFGYTRYAEVSDVNLTNVDVTGGNQAGGLVGFLSDYSVVSNVQTSGNVLSNFAAGGVVGYSTLGRIDNARSTATVATTGNSYAGGVVGFAEFTELTTSWGTGNVSGRTAVGGLAGAFHYGNLSASSAAGQVAGFTQVGGLVGLARDSLVTGSFATGAVQRNAAFTGNTFAFGGLVGWVDRGTATNVYATGHVQAILSGFTTDDVGGLFGRAHTMHITDAYATGDVTGSSQVGGLAGAAVSASLSYTSVDKAYATGTVNGTSRVGGLIGYVPTGRVTRSYATGNVTGTLQEIGGLMGYSATTIRQTYANGSVTGPTGAGGLLGRNLGTVDESYSRGAVTVASGNGGLIGTANSGSVTDSFWDTQTSGQPTSFGGVGRTTAQMRTPATYTGASWDFASTWHMSAGGTYPLFQWQALPPGVVVQGTVFNSAGTTAQGAGLGVTLLVNGVVFGTAATNSSGVYNFGSVVFADGDSLLAYLDNNVGSQGSTAWRTDGNTTTALNVLLSTVQATAAVGRTSNNGLFASAIDAVADADIPLTITIGGGETQLSLATGFHFLAPAGQTYRLDGNLSTAGGNVSLLGNVVVAASQPTIRTDAVGGTTAAGSVTFAASNGGINAAAAGVQGLIINTKADGGGAAGGVRLADVGTTARLKSITVASGAGILQLADSDGDSLAQILITSGNVDFSDVADVQLNAHTYINTQPGAAGQGNVLFQLAGGEMVGSVANRNLTIDVRGLLAGTADDGNVSLPASFGTNSIIGGSVDVNTDRGVITMGTITFATWKTADTGGGFAMRFTSDRTILTGDMTLESRSAMMDFDSTTFTSSAADRYVLNVRPNGGFNPAGLIRFAGADNSGGNYLRHIELNSDNFFHDTDGRVVFADDRDNQVDIDVDSTVYFFTGLRIKANNLVLEDNTVINSRGTSPGIIELTAANIDAASDNLSLQVSIIGPGSDSVGHIDFGTIGRDTVGGGGRYLGSLSATTTTGRVVVDQDITIDHTLGLGSINFSGPIAVAGTRTITTQVGDDGVAGNVVFNGELYATAADASLTINASAMGFAGGNVTLGLVGNRSTNSYLRVLDIDARGSSGGAVVLNGATVSLDGSGAATNVARFTVRGGGVVIGTNVTIDTEQGNNHDGGLVDFGATPLSATTFNRNLTIRTATTRSGGTGGNVALGDFGDATINTRGGFYIKNLVIDAGGPSLGQITTGADVQLDGSNSEAASLTLTGRYVLTADTLIDTERGGGANGGPIDLRLATVTASTAGLSLNLSALSTNQNGGDVFLRNFDASGGALIQNVSVNSRPHPGFTQGGQLTIDGNLTVAGSFDFGGGNVVISGASTVLDADGGVTLDAAQNSFVPATILMADGSTIRTKAADIILRADATIQLSRLNADGDATGGRGNVTISTTAGSITDNLTGDGPPALNIVSGNLSLVAGAGSIGTLTNFATSAGNALDVDAGGSVQDLRTSGAGNSIFVAFVGNAAFASVAAVPAGSAVGNLVLSATGNLDLGTAGNGLSLSTGDNVSLSAAGTLILPDAGLDVGSGLLRVSGTVDVRDVAGRNLGPLVASDIQFSSGNLGGGIVLATTASTITAQVTAAALQVDETDGLASVTMTSAGGNLTLNAGAIAALNLNAATGDVAVTSTSTISDTDAAVDILAGAATIQTSGAFGANGNSIGTTVGGLSVTSNNAGQWIAETDGLTALSLDAGTGNVTLSAGGMIADTDAAVDVLANAATFDLSGAFGATGNAIGTKANSLSVSSGSGSQWIEEATGLSALLLNAGTGNVTLSAGGPITDADGDVDVAANFATIDLFGDFGASGGSIGTTVFTLAVTSGNGSQWINETNGLAGLQINAGTGNVFLTAGGSVTDGDASPDIVASAADVQVTSGVFGASGLAIQTSVASLTTSTVNADQWIRNSVDLNALNLNAGTGLISLINTGAIQDSDAALDIVATTLQLTGDGDLGSILNPLGINVVNFGSTTFFGGAWIAETDGLSRINLNAPNGTYNLTSGGSIFDTDAVTDFEALAANVTVLNGDFGTSANPIGVEVSNLKVTTLTGHQWIYSFTGLTALNLDAGTRDISLTVAGTVTDSDSDRDILAGTVTIVTAGDFGGSANSIGTTVAHLSVTSANGHQWIAESDGLSSLMLNAGSGNVTLTAGGAIADTDAAIDVSASTATITLNGAIGSALNPLGTNISSLTAVTNGNGLWISETDGLTALDINAGIGNATLTAGGAILDTDALVDVVAQTVSITLTGNLGSAVNALGTTVDFLNVESGNASQWIAETDGLGSLNLSAGTGDISLIAGGAILDLDAAVDVVASVFTAQSGGDFGSSTTAVRTNVSQLSVDSGSNSQWITEFDGLSALNLNAGTGSIRLELGGSLTDTDALTDILASAAVVDLSGSFGSTSNPIGTQVADLRVVSSGNGGIWINEAGSMTALDLQTGAGDIVLTVAGSITDTDAANDLTAGRAFIQLNGNFGSATNLIGTDVDELSVDSTDGSQWIAEASGLTALDLRAGAGAITLSAGSDITDADAFADLTAASVSVTQLSGMFGSSTNAIHTAAPSLSVTTSSGYSQWIDSAVSITSLHLQADSADINLNVAGGVTDADASLDVFTDNFVLRTTGSVGTSANPLQTRIAGLTLDGASFSHWLAEHDGISALNINAGTGDVTLTAGGSITDVDASTDILAATARITLSGDFGSLAQAIDTSVDGLSVSSGNGHQWITELSGLTALSLNAGTGNITLRATTVADSDADVDILGNSFTGFTTGNFGTSSDSIGTTLTSLTLDSMGGNQWIAETDALTALGLDAGAGNILLTAGGSITDVDIASDLVGTVVSVYSTGDFGSPARAIGVAADELTVVSGGGNQRISETGGLSALFLDAGVGDVTFLSTGSVTDADALVDVVAANLSLTTSGNLGSSANAIGTSAASLTTNSNNFHQWINETDGLTALDLNAGTGDITLIAGGAVSDLDNFDDIRAERLNLQVGGDLGASGNMIGTRVSELTVNSGNFMQWIREIDGLSALNLQAGTGGVRLLALDSILDGDTDLDVVAASAIIQTNLGAIGAADATIDLAVPNLTLSSRGDQWLSSTLSITALDIESGLGAVTLDVVGAVHDDDVDRDIFAADGFSIRTTGDFGSSMSLINTYAFDVTIDSGNGSQWFEARAFIDQLNLSAGHGNIIIVANSAITDTDADVDIAAHAADIQLAAQFGSSVANPLHTNVTALTVSTNSSQWIREVDDLLTLNLRSGPAQSIWLSAGGPISDTDADVDIAAFSATVETDGNIGGLLNPLGTDVSSLTTSSSGGNQWIAEISGLNALNVHAGTGSLWLTAGESITDGDLGVDVVADAADIQLAGAFGSSSRSIHTTVGTLSVISAGGSQWITETDALTALGLNAGAGNITLTAGGPITDADDELDLVGAVVRAQTTGDFGASTQSIDVATDELTVVSTGGSQWITESDGVRLQNLVATGSGAIIDVTSSAGNLGLVRVTATDKITLAALAGSITDASDETSPLLTAAALDLTAAAGIGADDDADIDFAAANVTALNRLSGGINLQTSQTGAVSFDDVEAQNADGRILLDAASDTTFVSVLSAGGPITSFVRGDNDARIVNMAALGAGSIEVQAGRDARLLGEIVAAGTGHVLLQAGRDVLLDSDFALSSLAVRSADGDISAGAGRDVVLAAAGGRQVEIGSQSGNVAVVAGRDLSLTAISGGVARIGGRAGASGNLRTSSAGDTTLQAGDGAMSVVGHVSGTGHILTIADFDVRLASSGTGRAQIGHLNKTGFGDVDLAWDQAYPTGGGTATLTMSRTAGSTTAVTAGGALGRVRFFGGLRNDFVFLDRGVIINTHPFSGLRTLYPRAPQAGVPGSVWDQNIQYFNWPMETWNLYSLSSPGPETSPFTFYFYSNPPGMDVSRQALFFNLLNGLGFEYERAYLILDGLQRWINADVDVDTGGTAFDERRRNAVGPELSGSSSP